MPETTTKQTVITHAHHDPVLHQTNEHDRDTASGEPRGGRARGRGIIIGWHDGAGETFDGARPLDVLACLHSRLSFLQETYLACAENATALLAVEQAMEAMTARDARRTHECIAGTMAAGNAEQSYGLANARRVEPPDGVTNDQPCACTPGSALVNRDCPTHGFTVEGEDD